MSIVFSLKWKNVLRFFENFTPYKPLRPILSAKSTAKQQHMSDRVQRTFTVKERVQLRSETYVLYIPYKLLPVANGYSVLLKHY